LYGFSDAGFLQPMANFTPRPWCLFWINFSSTTDSAYVNVGHLFIYLFVSVHYFFPFAFHVLKGFGNLPTAVAIRVRLGGPGIYVIRARKPNLIALLRPAHDVTHPRQCGARGEGVSPGHVANDKRIAVNTINM
jgi:hypothetical protein